jgi:hypothetical protein
MLEPSPYSPSSSSIFSHAGDKSEHTRRPSYTSYPSQKLPSLTKSAAGLITDTFHGIFRIVLFKMFQISSKNFKSLRFPLLGCCRQLYTDFSASPHTGLLAFPDSHALPQVAVFWIRLCLSQSFLLFSPVHGYFYLRQLQHNSFPFSHWDSTHISQYKSRSGIQKYPSFVTAEPHFAISQHGHRIRSALSSTQEIVIYSTFKVH